MVRTNLQSPSHAADNRTWELLLHQRQGLTLDYIGRSWLAWSLPGLKKHLDRGLWLCQRDDFCQKWQLDRFYKWNSCLAQHLRARGWTNSPPLFNNWDDAGQPPSPTWSHLGHLFAGIAVSSWRSTERHEDFLFWKRSVSPCFLGVFFVVLFWVVFVFGFVLFRLRETPGFLLFTCLEQRENSWTKAKPFDDRQSLERARHELKKNFYEIGQGLVVFCCLLFGVGLLCL